MATRRVSEETRRKMSEAQRRRREYEQQANEHIQWKQLGHRHPECAFPGIEYADASGNCACGRNMIEAIEEFSNPRGRPIYAYEDELGRW